MTRKKRSGGWKTHKKAVTELERLLKAPLKKVGRSGIYLLDLPADHPIARKLK